MARFARRPAFYVLAGCGLLILLWAAAGLHYRSYQPERSDRFIWGAYHVHSDRSDGLGGLPEIAAAAALAGDRFVILSDHGSPNRGTALCREMIDGVALYGGSEAALPEGHLILFGQTEMPLCQYGRFPPDAVDDTRSWGGRAVVAYPASGPQRWRYWEGDFRPDGIELLNLVSEFKDAGFRKQAAAALFYPFTEYALLPTLSAPRAAGGRWDELLRRGLVAGYYAANAHGGIRLARRLPLPCPSYEAAFQLVGLGVDRSFAADPLEAVREGRFFSIVRGAGEPQEFSFTADHDGTRHPAAAAVSAPARLEAVVRTRGLRTRLVLLRDGRPVRASVGPKISLPGAGPGAYRVEVYLPGHPLLAPDVPWILSNPIRVELESGAPPPREEAAPVLKPVDPAEFAVEKDNDSAGRYFQENGESVFEYALTRYSEGGPNRWCALARRRPLDLAGMDGFYLEARTSETLRYFIELRCGDRWYYASLRVDPGDSRPVRVPFRHFYRVNGGRETMPLSRMDSMFLSVSNYNSATGFSARLSIRSIGFYSTPK